MDHRNSVHHHHYHPRYVPFHPHPPPPPQHPIAAGDRNFYTPHGPPPSMVPPPPLPSQMAYRPLPPPPPPFYESHQSHFTFLNSTRRRPSDAEPVRSVYHPQDELQHNIDLPPSPRVNPSQLIFNNNVGRPRPGFESSQTDLCDPSGVPSCVDLNPEQHYFHSFDVHNFVSPYRPIDKFREESEGSFRFREDYNDGFNCDDFHDSGQFISNPNNSSRNLEYDHFSSNRDYAEDLGNYKAQSGLVTDKLFRDARGEGLSENYRWGHTRQIPLGYEVTRNKESRNSDRFWIDSGKRAPLVSDSRKYNRGCRENGGEFVRTPRKSLQKKSALLRLQKPASRSRIEPSSASFDTSGPSSCRGKDLAVRPDHRVGGKREGSPVEFDVSFRSNVLVAKAIAAPSSPAVVSDRNSTPRTRKFRKVIVPNRNSSSLQLTTRSVCPQNSDGLAHVAFHDPSDPNKLLKLSEDRIEVSGIKSICDTDSSLHSNEFEVSLRKNMREGPEKSSVSDKVDSPVGCGKTPSVSVRKKKKIVTPSSCSAESGGTKKLDGSANGDSSSCNPSTEKITSAGLVMKGEVISQLSINEVTNEEDGTAQCMFSDKGGGIVDPGEPISHKIKRRRNSNCLLCSSSSEKTKTNEISDLSIHCLHISPKSDNGLTNLKGSSINSDIENVISLSGQNDPVMQPVNNNLAGVSDVTVSLESKVDVPMLSSGEFTFHKGPIDSYRMKIDMNSDNCAIKTQNPVCISGIGAEDGKHYCSNQAQLSLENVISEKFQKVVSSEKTGASLAFLNADSSGCSRGAATGSDSDLSHLPQKLSVCEMPCPTGVIVSPESGSTHRSTKAEVLLGNNLCVGSCKEQSPKSRKKIKLSSLQSDLPSSDVTQSHRGPENILNYSLGNDSNFSEEDHGVSGFASSTVGLEPCIDTVTISQGINSVEGLNAFMVSVRDDANVLNQPSPKCKKKREDFSGASTSDISGGCQNVHPPQIGTLVLSNFNEGITQSEAEVTAPFTGTSCSTGLLPFSEGMENCLKGMPSEIMGSMRDGFGNDCSKFDRPCSVQESSVLNLYHDFSSGLVAEQKTNATPLAATTNHHHDIRDVGSEKLCGMFHGEFVQQHKSPLKPQVSDVNKILPNTHVDCDSILPGKDDLPFMSNFVSLCADNIYEHGSIDSANNVVSNTGPHNLFSETESNHKLPLCEISQEKDSDDGIKYDETPVSNGDSVLPACDSLPHSKITSTFIPAIESDCLGPGERLKTLIENLKPECGESYGQKRQLSYSVPRSYPGYSTHAINNSKNGLSSNSMAKPRTWHRTGSPSRTLPLPTQLAGKIGRTQGTSYVRKGNSLVRKPASVAPFLQSSHGMVSSVYRLNPSNANEMKKTTGSGSRVDRMDLPNCLGIGKLSASSGRAVTRPPESTSRMSNCITSASGDHMSSPQATPLLDDSVENSSHSSKLSETEDASISSDVAFKLSLICENQINLCSNFDSQGAVNDENSTSSKMKDVIYVKRKSNQLVAASNVCDGSIHNVDKTHTSSSDGYYKKNRNQLIRTSLENRIGQTVICQGDSSISKGRRAPKIVSSRSLNRRRSEFLVRKRKPSKSSLVWTLGGTQSSKKAAYPSECRKMLPQLFPWKRTSYWRRSLHNSASSTNSLSMIGRKLLLLRKRDAVYTRSSHGFSLRKSKVLSIGGSNLKWSKSIEKRSKKASEEATIAVAEAERMKRRRSNADCVTSRTNGNHSSRKSIHSNVCPGERIFRIGLDRYKMDSSRTLQRIADEESCHMPIQADSKNLKKSYVPRRLLIGNDEYVRIGNGNQLIRDPKKRTRILASEKIRWSLHTARLRLAKKQKYCQFYTRFGQCNKGSGRCPYIHDPSKIAVCTKFLNGLCSNVNCKLTHKVIPERMQDCSYFLQGLCSNEKCPYRHVNVNPNASICEGFLKGYCADGDECRKKHSYVCPDYEATGICPERSKCKLHHPRKRNKGKKRKQTEGRNAQGRYFGLQMDNAELKIAASERHCVHGEDDILFKDGRFADYIGLDASDEEAGEARVPIFTCDDDSSGIQLDDLDQLIKPFRILN